MFVVIVIINMLLILPSCDSVLLVWRSAEGRTSLGLTDHWLAVGHVTVSGATVKMATHPVGKVHLSPAE